MLQDLRYAFRTLNRARGFALVTILVLALGIGANTAIFSIVNAALIRPLPYDHPERLITLFESKRGHLMSASGPNFRDWRDRAQSFASLAVYDSGPENVSGGREPERLDAAGVSKGFFEVMGAHPILGRTFRSEEERAGGALVAVIGEAFWRRSFGGSADALGRAITVEGKKHTIVGVLPDRFDFPRLAQVWIPMYIDADDSGRTAHNYRVIGRLKPDVSLAAAKAEMNGITQVMEHQYPDDKDVRAALIPLQAQASAKIAPTLNLLLGAVGFVLLIACVNVANLLISRAASRRREIAVRAALGAGTARLLRQLLTESLLLATAGGLLGLLLAGWTGHALASLIPPGMLPVSGVPLDGRVLGFALAASIVTGVLFGLAPAMFAVRADINEGLKSSSRAVSGAGTSRLRDGLVAFELGLSFVLLVGAGLTAKSLMALRGTDTGFDGRNVLTAALEFPGARFDDVVPYWSSHKPLPPALEAEVQRPVRMYESLLDRLKAAPGVQSAALTSEVPLHDFGQNGGFDIEGRPTSGGEEDKNWLEYVRISDDYFRVLNIRLKRGRFFDDRDRLSPDVTIINESTARKFWPTEDPLGHRIRFAGFEVQPKWLTIVGVVADTRSASFADQPAMASYVPFYQNPMLAKYLSVLVKASGPPPEAAVRNAIRSIDTQTPIEIRSMESIAGESVATPRLRTLLIAVFSLFALGLAAIGVYGVISSAVNQRTQEIGVRVALGATPSSLIRMLLAQAGILTIAGLAGGLAAALILTRVLKSFLYEVSPTDPATFVILAMVLAAIGLLAATAPALRAARLDPMTALREE